MAKTDVRFREIDMTAVVNQLDPQRLTRPEVVYETRKPKKEIPTQPGAPYSWTLENTSDD